MKELLLDVIHIKVYGSMTIHVIGGYTYFITFSNDHSKYDYVYLMKYKSESFKIFKELTK
jgi:hypothetical protein